MRLGIVGLPNVGKSTLFNALTQAGAEAANYPFCTIEPNIGVVSVPDERMDFLYDLYHPQKKTPATIEFLDIAGLVRGASKGEGLGNQFLANIREADALIHLVRCFQDSNVIHVEGDTDPKRDIDIIDTELILADLVWMEKRISKVKTQRKGKENDSELFDELTLLERIQSALNEGIPARRLEFTKEDSCFLKNIFLLSLKPVLYVANVAESQIQDASNLFVQTVRDIATEDRSAFVVISAKIEEEISVLDSDDKKVFLSDLGLSSSGLDQVIRASYSLLGYISFFTGGPTEVRAWTISKGTKAPQAAGKIHSDFERGFIRAEIVSFQDLFDSKTYHQAREKGLIRSEGKDYVMRDGDVVLFRFNV